MLTLALIVAGYVLAFPTLAVIAWALIRMSDSIRAHVHAEAARRAAFDAETEAAVTEAPALFEPDAADFRLYDDIAEANGPVLVAEAEAYLAEVAE